MSPEITKTVPGESRVATQTQLSGERAEPWPPLSRNILCYSGYVVLAIVLIASQLPLLLKLGRLLFERPQYEFFPLMIGGAIWIAWERWRDARHGELRVGFDPRLRFPRLARCVTPILLALSLATLVIGGLFWIRIFAGISSLLLLVAAVWHVGGLRGVRVFAPSFLLLAVIIPPPARLDDTLTLRLQHLAVSASSRLLDWLHVPHLQAGNVLEIPGRRLLVEQACSGINSLMSILAFALLFGFWKRRSPPRIILLLAAAFFFVIWANVLRITGEAWLKVRWNIDILEGAAHELMGLLLFLVCAALVASADVLIDDVYEAWKRARNRVRNDGSSVTIAINNAWRPASDKHGLVARATGTPDTQAEMSVRLPKLNWRHWFVAGVFAIAGVFVQTQVSHAWSLPAISEYDSFELPEKLGEWDRIETGVSFIERPQTIASKSYVWHFRRDDLIASVAMDFPFREYHDLTTCYTLSGWSIASRIAGTETTTAGNERHFEWLQMTKMPSYVGYLMFGLIAEDGQWFSGGGRTYSPGLKGMLELVRRDGGRVSYQIQTLVQSKQPLTPDQQRDVDRLFAAASENLSEQLMRKLGRQ